MTAVLQRGLGLDSHLLRHLTFLLPSHTPSPPPGLSHASPAKEEADKTERLLPFREFSDLIAQHPLVEMMISVQFQGPAKDKMGS